MIPPPVAVRVRFDVATLAVGATARVMVTSKTPADGLVTGEKLGVTPTGIPATTRFTGALNPPVSVSVTLKEPVEPRAIVCPVELSLNVKVGGGVTDTVRVTDSVNPPPFAVIVIVRLPTAAFKLATSVKTLDPDPGAAKEDGEKLAVTPLGNPLALRLTKELKPFTPLTATVAVALLPCTRLAEDSLAVKVKVGGGFTVTAIGSVPVSPPPVAVIVMV